MNFDRYKHPSIWQWNKRNVAKSAFIGLFIAMLPLPFQMPIAALSAIYFKANMPLAVGLVWLSNPVTIIPIAWLCLTLGCALLQIDPGISATLAQGEFQAAFVLYWKPFFIGCLAVGTTAGMLGYYLTLLCWRDDMKISLQRWLRNGLRSQSY